MVVGSKSGHGLPSVPLFLSTTTHTMDDLPVELLALIVSFASGQDLKALSLVSSRFTEHCQRRLYASLTISGDLVANNSAGMLARRLYEAFRQFSHLGGYVHNCTLHLRDMETVDNPLAFLAMLRLLSSVRSVKVYDVVWRRLSETLRTAVVEFMEPVLHRRGGQVALDHIDDLPIDVFDHIARRATHLVLRQVQVTEGDLPAHVADGEADASPSLLKTLVLQRGGIHSASPLTSTRYLGSLETLEALLDGKDQLKLLEDIAHCASPTVRQLTIKIPVHIPMSEFASSTLGLIFLPSVEIVHYGFMLADRRSTSSRLNLSTGTVYVHQLQVILRTLPSLITPRLRRLHIHIDMDIGADLAPPVEYVLSTNLAEFDNTLASRIHAGSGRIRADIGVSFHVLGALAGDNVAGIIEGNYLALRAALEHGLSSSIEAGLQIFAQDQD
ncbi:hypothetical protein HMN09_01004000 [Mycena chlorophos]|uniref:F-box domain-containing protein n=1 Tax=Mycena chlorophos TaxID=658473 RepID=A0A8H6SIA5_MYCCL|nr:hypothetical protein HMN09_01004000 [Mycena chlorophos]